GHVDRDRITADLHMGLQEIEFDYGHNVAVAFSWRGDPEHSRLSAAGEAILAALAPLHGKIALLLLAIDGDIGKTFGHILHGELKWPGKIICIDGVELHELDYIDVGELIAPPGVVPVVIKSLL